MLIVSKNTEVVVFSEKITAIEVCGEKLSRNYIIKAYTPVADIILGEYDSKEEALLILNKLRMALIDGNRKSIILN